MHIYVIINKLDGKIYVGKSFRRFGLRENEHFKFALAGKNYCPYLYNAIRMYGKDAFEVCMLSGYATSREDLSTQEKYYIAKHRANDCQFGYNLTSGGEGADYWSGKKRSSEDRAKMSAAKLGTKQSPEHVAKRSKAMIGNTNCLGRKQSEEERRMRSLASPRWMLGRHLSEETKEKISQSVSVSISGDKNPFFGKRHTEESRRKMSEALTGRYPSVETLQKRSAALKGKKRTEDTKKRMSEAAKKRGVSAEHIRHMVECRLAKRAVSNG
jgi:group I intron endonuclease